MAGAFRFKQFTVANDRAAMKVGTDGVLLGAWASVQGARRILDVGTGTGIIALMLAQRCGGAAQISAIDIDPGAVEEASDNFGASPWGESFREECISLQEFSAKADAAGTFDLIVSNPPYFVGSLKAPDQRRSAARHTDTLEFRDLALAALKLLAPDGCLAVVYPVEEGMAFVAEAESLGLHLMRLCRVSTAAGKPAKRLLLEFSRTAASPLFEELSLDSPAYRALTADFYL